MTVPNATQTAGKAMREQLVPMIARQHFAYLARQIDDIAGRHRRKMPTLKIVSNHFEPTRSGSAKRSQTSSRGSKKSSGWLPTPKRLPSSRSRATDQEKNG